MTAATAEVHALHRSWKLWYDSPTTYNNSNWELSLIPIVTVKTVEDFFAMLHFLKPVHNVRMFAQLHFFQENVKPMWEDAANKEGGKLWLNLDVDQGKSNAEAVNSIWVNILMAIVGEVLEDPESEGSNDIMGVVLSKKKNYNRLSIWIRDAQQSESIERIRKSLEDVIPSTYNLTFTKHGDKQQ